MHVNVAETLSWTRELAREASARATAMLSGFARYQKADGSVVTDIDRSIEQFLRGAIQARFPGHAILGEEFGREGDASAPLWALDPVDGTTNLACGLPHWGISIGLIAGGKPVVGVLAFPLLGETYAGADGITPTRNDAPLAALGTGGPTHWEDTYAICSSSVRDVDFARLPARLRVFGSAALDLCWTAKGVVKGCHSIGVSAYDIAAGLCIAGGMGCESRWLKSGELLDLALLADSGPRPSDVLITAPPETLAFVRARLAWR